MCTGVTKQGLGCWFLPSLSGERVTDLLWSPGKRPAPTPMQLQMEEKRVHRKEADSTGGGMVMQ